MERLDDAVRRILRVKINSGIFKKVHQALVQTGNENLALPKNRKIATKQLENR